MCWKLRHHIAQLLLYPGLHKGKQHQCVSKTVFLHGGSSNESTCKLIQVCRFNNICVVLDFIKFLKCLTVENGQILLSASKKVHYTLMNYPEWKANNIIIFILWISWMGLRFPRSSQLNTLGTTVLVNNQKDYVTDWHVWKRVIENVHL